MDGTLLSVDAGVQWIEYLAKHSGVDMSGEVAQCHQFLADYRAGNFDVEAFMAYHMTILSRFPRQFLLWIRENFLKDIIFPKITFVCLGTCLCHEGRRLYVGDGHGDATLYQRPHC